MSETTQPILLHSVVVAHREQLSTNLGNEVVILHLHVGAYYGVGQVGGLIWNLIQEPRKVCDIRDAILEEYDIDIQHCERDLLAFLEELSAHQLIEVKSNMEVFIN